MNPFREVIVSDPWRAAAVDVPEIQKAVFDECLRGVEHVRLTKHSAALLIHGGAGAGKTHLLSRLRSHLTLKAPTATDRDECLFVWVRLQASPRMIWRVVRRTLVEDWFRPVCDQRTQFERILFHRLAEIRIAEGDLEPWYEYMLETDPAGLDELLERVADSLNLDRNTTIAFKHLAFGRHRRDLRAWLGGDSLPEEALARLGLSQDEGTDEEREHEARRVTLMLCRLAGDGLPIVLSLDQIEALQSTAGDRDGLFAFGQLASTLHDETSNVLVVSCVQSAFATEVKDQLVGADYDRITSLGARSLATLTRREAERLIAARLTLLDGSQRDGLHPEETANDPLWPLDAAEVERLLASGSLTPRKLLATCAERFEAKSARVATSLVAPVKIVAPAETDPQIGASSADSTVTSPVVPIPEFLNDEWSVRVERALATNRPEQTDGIVRHGLPLLMQVAVPDWKSTHDEQLVDVPLIFEGSMGRSGVSLCTQANMTSLAGQLRRLKSQTASQRLRRLVVLRDIRVSISPNAVKVKQYLEELRRAGAVVVYPTAEVLAALDALRALLSEAKAGDLAHGAETVSPQTVEQWLRQNLESSLWELVEQVTGSASSIEEPATLDTAELEELAALLNERPLLSVAEAATRLNRSSRAIMATIQRDPGRFGLLTGPPAVLFRLANETKVVSLSSQELSTTHHHELSSCEHSYRPANNPG